LFKTKLFTKHLENGYQQAYQRYFNGEEPDTIIVPEWWSGYCQTNLTG